MFLCIRSLTYSTYMTVPESAETCLVHTRICFEENEIELHMLQRKIH